MKNTSGSGENAEVPPQLQKWNWAAFFLWPWWLKRNGIPLSVGKESFIPLLGIYICGYKSYGWLWKHQRWVSVEQLLEHQRQQLRDVGTLYLIIMLPAFFIALFIIVVIILMSL
jgi:hypothetical protein